MEKQGRSRQLYKIIRKISEGTEGIVYEVEVSKGPLQGKRFAMKDINKDKYPGDLYGLRDSIKIQDKLDHPNILKIIEVLEDEDTIVMIMDLCEEDLTTFLTKNELSREETRRIFKQIVEAVAYLEDQNILHSDIKKPNILICNGVPKLADFGMAIKYRVYDGFPQTDAYNYAVYFAPEMGDPGYTMIVNSWQLGIVLYGMLFWHSLRQIYPENLKIAAYKGGHEYVKTIDPEIPIVLRDTDPNAYDLLKRALQPDPKKRISVKEMLEHPYLK